MSGGSWNVFSGTRRSSKGQRAGIYVNQGKYCPNLLPTQDDMITWGFEDIENNEHNICGVDGIRYQVHWNINKQTNNMSLVLAYNDDDGWRRIEELAQKWEGSKNT